jgi:RNase P subunit RPR2
MFCQRCRGLLVQETCDDLNLKTDSLYTATRCINCGHIEDAVVRANRFRPSERMRPLTRRVVRAEDGMREQIQA